MSDFNQVSNAKEKNSCLVACEVISIEEKTEQYE